jgi:hypothetical protein
MAPRGTRYCSRGLVPPCGVAVQQRRLGTHGCPGAHRGGVGLMEPYVLNPLESAVVDGPRLLATKEEPAVGLFVTG